jgi:predicted alpha/beta-hydrolase family hydrolase
MSSTNLSITRLEIRGYKQRQVENRFFRQEGTSETLGVIYPGLRYTSDMPLLYYTTRLLTQRGSDVLQLWADYSSADYQSLSREQRAAWLEEDGRALIQAGQKQRDYGELILVGKSIGTLALAELVFHEEMPENSISIWLTPLLHLQHVVAAARQLSGPALFVGGNQDPAYAQEGIAQLKGLPNILTITIEGANHSLEIPGDLPRSLKAMQEILQAIADFLARSS